jgi:sugar phosphate isomerase/epimerase
MTRHRDTVPELIATCWTSAGDAAPGRGDESSPVDLRHRIETVARTGWQGFGLVHADLVAAKETIGLGTLARILTDNGIKHVELEFLDDWWTSGPSRHASNAVRADLLAAAPVLGVEHIKIGAGLAGASVPPDLLARSFDDLATEAATAGVRIAVEPAPFSCLPTIQAGVRLITEVANPNGGLMIDIWHVYRSGCDYAALSRMVPPEYVFGIEINDGAAAVVGTLFEDTVDRRMLCGEGDFDVPGFIRAAHRFGFTGPWGVEIISEIHRALAPEEALTKARDAALRCFALAVRSASPVV